MNMIMSTSKIVLLLMLVAIVTGTSRDDKNKRKKVEEDMEETNRQQHTPKTKRRFSFPNPLKTFATTAMLGLAASGGVEARALSFGVGGIGGAVQPEGLYNPPPMHPSHNHILPMPAHHGSVSMSTFEDFKHPLPMPKQPSSLSTWQPVKHVGNQYRMVDVRSGTKPLTMPEGEQHQQNIVAHLRTLPKEGRRHLVEEPDTQIHILWNEEHGSVLVRIIHKLEPIAKGKGYKFSAKMSPFYEKNEETELGSIEVQFPDDAAIPPPPPASSNQGAVAPAGADPPTADLEPFTYMAVCSETADQLWTLCSWIELLKNSTKALVYTKAYLDDGKTTSSDAWLSYKEVDKCMVSGQGCQLKKP